jgi:hypothetical protein
MRVVAVVCGVVVLGPACGEAETCASRLGRLCEGPSVARETLLRVDGAVRVDFEGDGEMEVFAFAREARQVAAARSQPEDEFSQPSTALFLAATPTSAAALATAGGAAEVVVGLAGPPGLAFFGLDADGRLEQRRELALVAAPEALWAGDLDGDGRPELLVAAATTGTISVLDPNTGDARELARGTSPVAMAVGELDGDGTLDIVVADQAQLLVLRGAGAGEFRAAKPFALGAPVASLELADVDGDGALDALARGAAEPAVVVCRNLGAGELAAPVRLPFAAAKASGVGLVASPADGGVVGVSVPQGDRVATWYTQAGDSWLGHAEVIAEVIVEDAVFPFTELRDVDGDGHLDQLGVQVTGDFVFRPGAGDGTFTGELDGYDFPFPAAGVFAAAGAQVDVVTVSQDGVAAHRLREVPRIEPVGGVFGYLMSGTSDIAIGDIDRDGADDVVAIAGAANGGIAVLWGGAGGLARMDVVASPIETKGLTLADLDGDGSPEVVTSNGISRIEANRFWPRREALFVPLALGTLDRVHDLLVQDVDGDGRLDVLALFEDAYGGGGARLAVTYGLAGDEDPPYTEWQLLLAAPELGVASLAAADVNDDGRVDLLVRPSERGASVLLLNEGPRAWSAGVTIAGESAALVDAPDGADLLVQAEGKIRRFEVAGAELVARETLLEDATLTEGRFVRAAEIDGDEPVDLIVETATLTTIWIDAGRGYAPWLRISTDEMKRVDVGDFDGDGRTDLIGRIDGRVAVRLSGDDAAP